MSPLATQPCPCTWTATSPTGCTTPSSATPSPSSSSSATSTTRPTAASSPSATPPPPRQARRSPTGPSMDSARPPTEQWWWGAKRRSRRRTPAGGRGKEGPNGIRGRGVRKVQVNAGRTGLVQSWLCRNITDFILGRFKMDDLKCDMYLFKPWFELT